MHLASGFAHDLSRLFAPLCPLFAVTTVWNYCCLKTRLVLILNREHALLCLKDLIYLKSFRAGWKAAHKCIYPTKMSIPALLGINVRSLFTKCRICPSHSLQSPVYLHARIGAEPGCRRFACVDKQFKLHREDIFQRQDCRWCGNIRKLLVW